MRHVRVAAVFNDMLSLLVCFRLVFASSNLFCVQNVNLDPRALCLEASSAASHSENFAPKKRFLKEDLHADLRPNRWHSSILLALYESREIL